MTVIKEDSYTVLARGKEVHIGALIKPCPDCPQDENCPIQKYVKAIQAQEGQNPIDITTPAKSVGLEYRVIGQVVDWKGPAQGKHWVYTCPKKEGTIEVFVADN